jgi:hypothetical protein
VQSFFSFSYGRNFAREVCRIRREKVSKEGKKEGRQVIKEGRKEGGNGRMHGPTTFPSYHSCRPFSPSFLSFLSSPLLPKLE